MGSMAKAPTVRAEEKEPAIPPMITTPANIQNMPTMRPPAAEGGGSERELKVVRVCYCDYHPK